MKIRDITLIAEEDIECYNDKGITDFAEIRSDMETNYVCTHYIYIVDTNTIITSGDDDEWDMTPYISGYFDALEYMGEKLTIEYGYLVYSEDDNIYNEKYFLENLDKIVIM